MSKPNRVFFAAFLALVGFHATPASAGNTAFLSRTGTGSTCSQAAPCASMSSALTAAGTGGEVICLDKSGYGFAPIAQSVTISCGDGLWEATSAPISINTPAGSDVVIEGLVSDGAGTAGTTMHFLGQSWT